MRPPPVPPPVLKRPHAQPPPQGRRAPFAAPRRPGCGHRDRELRGRPGPGAVPPAVPHSPAVPRPPRELRAVTPWPLSLCCCACRLRCCGETEAPPCPGGGAALPHGHVGRPGALRSAVARGWHRGCGTGAPRDPSASAGASLRCPSRVTHSSPTRPDPTRPLQWDRSAVCVSVCPQPSTAQHCTALHSTACGPAGTFPHRVPGLWGCGAVGLWGDGVEVMGWRCWPGAACSTCGAQLGLLPPPAVQAGGAPTAPWGCVRPSRPHGHPSLWG